MESYDVGRTRCKVYLPDGRSTHFSVQGGLWVNDANYGTHPYVNSPNLYCCPLCLDRNVSVEEQEEREDGQFDVVLSCPNCGWEKEARFEALLMEYVDAKAEKDRQAMVSGLPFGEVAEAEIERLRQALADDLLLPEDF
jgi:hypothetical protein